MIKRLFVIILTIILISFGAVGCKEFGCTGCTEINWIVVNVNADAQVTFSDGKEPPTEIWWEDMQVEIEIIKAGGERVNFLKYTGDAGYTETVSYSFQVYKEQPVQVKVRPIYGVIPDFAGGGFLDYSKHTYLYDEETLLWEDIYPVCDFGDTYTWDITVKMLVRPILVPQ